MKTRGRPKNIEIWSRTKQLYWEMRSVDPKVSASEVHNRYKIQYPADYPAESTVRKIIQHEKERSKSKGKPILDQAWIPWRTSDGNYSEYLLSDSEPGSEMPYLALLGLVKEATTGESPPRENRDSQTSPPAKTYCSLCRTLQGLAAAFVAFALQR